MNKLIKSDLRLTLRHPIFIFGMLLTLAVNLWFHLKDNSGGSIEYIFRPFLAFFLLAPGMCVLTMFTCGTDLSSRTVNRKLSMGYTKKQIYFSHLVSSLTASFLLTIPCFVSIIVPAYLAKLNFGVFFVYYIYSLISLFAMTALIVALSMFIKIRVVALLLSFAVCSTGVFFWVYVSGDAFGEKYYDEYEYIESATTDAFGNEYIIREYNGKVIKVKNAKYIVGVKRVIYKNLACYSPTGFLFDISGRSMDYAEGGFDDVRDNFTELFGNKAKDDSKTIPFSLFVFALFSLLGAEAFRRRELS